MNDLISRQAAIEAINKALDRETLLYSFVRKVATDAVKALPSAQPETCAYWDRESNFCALHRPSAQQERKKGRWTLKENVFGVAYCSECDYELHTNDTNFSPNCGADMRGEQA